MDMIKFNMKTIDGYVVKEDSRYLVRDNTSLKNLVVSSTKLNPNKETTGHKHDGQEEVYMFLEGSGRMWLDDDEMPVHANEIVLIEDGVFHKVAAGDDGLYFVCVFQGERAS
jgi:mannose-6-phosphate isomerase-like protein (cupin superfamily)